MKKDRDFVSKKRAREREVIVRRGAKSRTLEDSRHSSGRCTDRAKVIPAWCATVLHTANGVGNSLGLAVPGISALLLARYPSPRDKDVTASWRPTIPSSPSIRVSGSIRANGNGFRAGLSFETFLLSWHDGRW